MTVYLSPLGGAGWQFLDANANPLVGGKLYTYTAGTTTPQTTYSEYLGVQANTNPIVLDAAGRIANEVWLTSGVVYKFVLYTSDNVLVWSKDNIAGINDIAQFSSQTGSDQIGFIQAGTGAVLQTAQSKMRQIINAADFGAIADFSTDNTSAVQAAINSLGVYGGNVNIPYGAKFNLKGLVLPALVNLTYRVNDDTSAPGPSSDIGSNELVEFSSNSSYPLNPSGAAVNEWRFTSPFHPGIITDVRKDLTSAATWLAPGQSLTNPVRSSWLMMDEQVGFFQVAYVNYPTTTTFSGVDIQVYQNKYRLSGVGTGAWVSVPPVGTIVTGAVSGAVGKVRDVQAGYMDVEWFSGKFQTGEHVIDNNETSSSLISGVVFTRNPANPLKTDLYTGAWTIGDRPNKVATEALNISGNLLLTPTRGGSTVVPKTVANPTVIWNKNNELASPIQLGLQYDPTYKTDTTRRLKFVGNDLATYKGELVPVFAMARFTSTLAIGTNATNVALITRTGTGIYRVDFTVSAASTAYIALVSLDRIAGSAGWSVGPAVYATGSITINLYNATNVAADLPAGVSINVMVMGGE